MRVALLAGGTGGAKLANGFQQVLAPGELSIVANVADDFEHWGLHVCPDIDSILYTLAGLLDRERGWGIAGDSSTALQMLGRYGEPTWFQIGDGDLATHVHRTRLLRDGASMTEVTAALGAGLGLRSHLLPATDDRLRTLLETDAGEVEFQDYFVRLKQEPKVEAVRFEGLETARPTDAVLAAVADAGLVVIAPSNPIVSIGPILALAGMKEAVAAASAPRVAVSPIVGGRALKGPADRMLASLGQESTATGVARLYAGLVDHYVIDEADAALTNEVESLGMTAVVLPTVMRSNADQAALANAILVLATTGTAR